MLFLRKQIRKVTPGWATPLPGKEASGQLSMRSPRRGYGRPSGACEEATVQLVHGTSQTRVSWPGGRRWPGTGQCSLGMWTCRGCLAIGIEPTQTAYEKAVLERQGVSEQPCCRTGKPGVELIVPPHLRALWCLMPPFRWVCSNVYLGFYSAHLPLCISSCLAENCH